jgi:hypothetical protein
LVFGLIIFMNSTTGNSPKGTGYGVFLVTLSMFGSAGMYIHTWIYIYTWIDIWIYVDIAYLYLRIYIFILIYLVFIYGYGVFLVTLSMFGSAGMYIHTWIYTYTCMYPYV